MIALAQLLSPAQGQGSSDVTPATREFSDIRAHQDDSLQRPKVGVQRLQVVEAGILSLELKLVASNGGTELVREIDLHPNNPEGLLGLWKATCRPEPSSEKYEPLQVVEKTEDGRYRMQWTGFDALENTSLEPPWRIRKIAPELLKEYRNKRTGYQAKRPAKTTTRAIKAAKPRKPQRPRRQSSQKKN
ncbi:hypothetical protein MY8738_001535 [Beauveria namnaoensis]